MFSQAQCLLWTSLGTSGLLQLIFQHERILPAKQIFFIWDIVVRRWTRNSVQASSVFFPLLPAEPTVRAYSAGELLKFVCHLKIATLHWGKSSKAHKSLHWPILQARFVTWVSFCEERPNVSNLITCSTGGATIQHPLAMYLSSTQITRFGCFSAFQLNAESKRQFASSPKIPKRTLWRVLDFLQRLTRVVCLTLVVTMVIGLFVNLLLFFFWLKQL